MAVCIQASAADKDRDKERAVSHLVCEEAGKEHSNDGQSAAHEGCLSEAIPVG